MADIINLRRARKLKARDEADKQAEANRLCFGRSKAQKQSSAAVNAQADRFLDAHRRSADEDSERG